MAPRTPSLPSAFLQYENLYAVVHGTKIFHLLPPTELYRMSLQLYPAARYEAQVGPGLNQDTTSNPAAATGLLLGNR